MLKNITTQYFYLNVSTTDSTRNGLLEKTGITSKVIVECVYLSIVELLILFGNSLVILAFLKGHRSIRTYTNYFVVNLAVSDLMVGCLSLPYWICTRLKIDKSDALQKYFLPLDVLFGTTSILSLAAISVERMYAVKYPTRHRNLTHRPVFVSIGLTWAVSVILTLVNIQFDESGKNLNKDSTTAIFVVAFILPLLIIFGSYAVLFVTAARLTKADNKTKSISREIQIAKTISVIISLFVIFWAPFFVLNIVYGYCNGCLSDSSIELFTNVSKALHYSNSMMNFFVYAVRSPDFRETFKALVFRCNTQEIRERVRLMSFSSTHRNKTIKS